MISDQKGLSLIEVLVTIVIIGVVFVLLSQSIGFFTIASNKHNDQKEATEIVEQELNKALDRLERNLSLADSYVIDDYLVTIHTSKLTESVNVNSSLPHHLSLTGVFDNESEPGLVTVTVSWGN